MNLSTALLMLAASYETSDPEVKPFSKKQAKVQAGKVSAPAVLSPAEETAPIAKAPVKVAALPRRGTIDAATFLSLVNGANVNWIKEGAPFPRHVCQGQTTDRTAPHFTSKVGLDQEGVIHAIASYVGYDRTKPFDGQDYNARRTAMLELRPNLRPILVKPSLTIAGIVAGMPDPQGKILADLKARERNAVASIAAFGTVRSVVAFRKAIQDHLDPETHDLLLQAADHMTEEAAIEAAGEQAAEETKRLATIRKDLAEQFR